MNSTEDVARGYRVLDWAQAMEKVGGDEDLLREIAAMFVEEAPGMMTALRDALNRADSRALERTAHSLKGCVGNFGAKPALDAAFDLEQSGRAQDLARVGPALARLDEALRQLMPELAAVAAGS